MFVCLDTAKTTTQLDNIGIHPVPRFVINSTQNRKSNVHNIQHEEGPLICIWQKLWCPTGSW